MVHCAATYATFPCQTAGFAFQYGRFGLAKCTIWRNENGSLGRCRSLKKLLIGRWQEYLLHKITPKARCDGNVATVFA